MTAQFPGEQSKTSEVDRYTDSPVDLYPEGLRKEIDELNAFINENVNDGGYRAGFASSQQVYEQEVGRLFNALDQLAVRLFFDYLKDPLY